MKRFILYFPLGLMIILYGGCTKAKPADTPKSTTKLLFALNIDPTTLPMGFSADTTAYTIDKNLPEASGILYSRINNQIIWVEQDSGNGQFLWVYSTTGHQEKKIALLNTMTHDAEDIAYGPDENGNYNRIFLADIGDNKLSRSTVDVYTYEEPQFSDTASIPAEMTALHIIQLKYPGSSENAEALLVDPITNRMYIFSKASSVSHVYTLDFPYQYDAVNNLKHVGDIDIRFEKVTAADISPDGMNILLKTYDYILYWKRKPGEDLNQTFARMPVLIPYQAEVQGEAVTWGKVPDEYFTYSENSHGVVPELYRYERKIQ